LRRVAFEPALSAEAYAYLTTRGRRSGLPREIEIWFALAPDGATVYLLAGGGERANWVRNLRVEPGVMVRIAGVTLPGRAEVIDADSPEDSTAREALLAKYGTPERPLERWRRTGLPVAIRV
jgi:deazaflavin-dependent oxidoreductase (nitroreductase family)